MDTQENGNPRSPLGSKKYSIRVRAPVLRGSAGLELLEGINNPPGIEAEEPPSVPGQTVQVWQLITDYQYRGRFNPGITERVSLVVKVAVLYLFDCRPHTFTLLDGF